MKFSATVGLFLLVTASHAASTEQPGSIVLNWNSATLEGIRDSNTGAPMAARALAIVHTCMYDAWAAYDDRAVGTQLIGALRRPESERTLLNKGKPSATQHIALGLTCCLPILIQFTSR